MVDRLLGKVAIVTGGAMGQGAGISRAYVAEGAKVVIADVAKDEGQALADELGGERALRLPRRQRPGLLDVADRRHQRALRARRRSWPTTPASCASAASRRCRIDEVELLFRVNQLGCWLGMQAVVPNMREAGGGAIINASSTEGLGGMANTVAYGATKFAIRGMTKGASHELGKYNIRVNSVHPGMIDTPMTRVHGGDVAMEYGASKIPLRRVGHPEDVAPLYVFLGSEESSYINGAEIAVDGGVTATHAFGG